MPLDIIKIDEPMAEHALRKAARIGVLATLPTTLGLPVCLVKFKAAEGGREVQVVEAPAEGVFQAPVSGVDAVKAYSGSR